MTLLERSATTSYNTLPRHPGRLRDNFSRLLEYLHLLFHPHGTPHPRGVRCNERCDVSPRDISVPGQLQALPPVLDSSPTNNSDYTSHHYPVGDVQSPKLSSSKLCESFGQKDLGIVGSCPIDAGGSADVWLGERNGETVAIKSYRHNASSDRFIVYLRHYKETSTYSYLNGGNENIVRFIGIYSSPEHPFCLVFEYMAHLNLREFLRNNQNVGRPKLLLEIARGLSYIHDRGIVHGNLTISNVLVGGDGRARIAGLGTAFIAPGVPIGVPIGAINQPFHGALAPELIDPLRWGLTDPEPTTASDVFAFAFVAWEAFDGRPPFSDRSVVAGVYSLLKDTKPGKPDHSGLSRRMWKMIRGSWESDPVKRMTLSEVVTILELENSHKSK